MVQQVNRRWSEHEKKVLEEVVTDFVRSGGSQWDAFEFAGKILNRTRLSCKEKWNSVVRKNEGVNERIAEGYKNRPKEAKHVANQKYRTKKESDTSAEYAVYVDDDLIVVGTMKECADYLEIKVSSFYSYMTPSRKRGLGGEVKRGKRLGMEIIKIDDEEEEDW